MTPEATSAEALGYDVFAIAGIVVAGMLQSWRRILLTVVTGVLPLAIVVAFAIPAGHWELPWNQPTPHHTLSPSFTPCYSGSNDCN